MHTVNSRFTTWVGNSEAQTSPRAEGPPQLTARLGYPQ